MELSIGLDIYVFNAGYVYLGLVVINREIEEGVTSGTFQSDEGRCLDYLCKNRCIPNNRHRYQERPVGFDCRLEALAPLFLGFRVVDLRGILIIVVASGEHTHSKGYQH